MRARLDLLDADKDGRLDKSEWPTGRERAFILADADKDGYVTLTELAALLSRRRR